MLAHRNRHRCEVEIAASILSSVAFNPMRKTLIMNAVNLNHEVLKKYLARLLKTGFLVQVNDAYKLSEMGQAFLEEFTRFRRMEDMLMKRNIEEKIGTPAAHGK